MEVRARVEDTSRSIHFEGAFELDTGASWETAFPLWDIRQEIQIFTMESLILAQDER